MSDALKHISNKFNVSWDGHSEMPIRIPNTTRQDLVELYAELGYKTGAEIGVERGVFSEQICLKNPSAKLYCIDAWKVYDENDGYSSQKTLDIYSEQTKQALKKYNCEIIKKISQEAVKDFEKESLDFAYLDANHRFDYIMQEIISWSRIVRPGGIVSGHDYVGNNVSHTIRYGVIDATNAYTKAHNINPWFVLDGERSASWFWVKD